MMVPGQSGEQDECSVRRWLFKDELCFGKVSQRSSCWITSAAAAALSQPCSESREIKCHVRCGRFVLLLLVGEKQLSAEWELNNLQQ